MQEQQAHSVRQISLTTNDIVYNPQTQMIYASVPSTAGANGNSIVPIDPFTGSVGTSTFIGSEPNRLAVSDDGQALYAILNGAQSIRRFDIPTQTAGLQFATGYEATDIDVAPGTRDTVAVTGQNRGVSPFESGVAIFDNGVQRPTTSNNSFSANRFIEFSASPTKLYGGGSLNGSSFTGLSTYTVDSSGVTFTSSTPFTVGSDIKFDNGRVYSATGQVINPDTGTLLGTFSNAGTGSFVPDSSVGRAYFLTGDFSGGNNLTLTLQAYDINTFVPLGTLAITGVNGEPSSLVRWGANGLAFRTTRGQLFLIQTSLIPSPEPIPTPTPTPSATPTPTPTPVEVSVREIRLANNDIVIDGANQMIYASVPSTAGARANSLTPINPETGVTGNSVFVGSEPTELAVSDNGQFVYVHLDGAAAIRRFDTASQTAGLQFATGIDPTYGPLFATDIAVMPGHPETVAVARTNRIVSPSSNGVVLYDDGVPRPKIPFVSSYSLAFSSSPTRLYSSGSGSFNKLTVEPDGLTNSGFVTAGSGGYIIFDNGLLYTSNGSVVEPEAGVLRGTFSGIAGFSNDSSAMAVDSSLGRAYFLSTRVTNVATATLRVYDINTFVPLGTVTFQIALDNVGGSFQGKVVRWGANGLAFRTRNAVYLIQTSLVNPAGSVPAPTPTPSPTPTPTPSVVQPFVRELDLPANAVEYHQPSQTLYAAVPGRAGANGNSITAINPATGAIGTSVFVGSEPNRLAMSDNGQYLYTWLEGAGAIRRFDIASQTAGLQFSVGNQFLADLAAMPGSPQTLATAQSGVVKVYDDGVQRPQTANASVGPIEFSSSPATLYGYNNGTSGHELVKLNVNASGVQTVSSTGNLITNTADIKFVNGRLYASTGRVVDPEATQLIGTFQPGFQPAFAVDAALGRAFFVSGNGQSATLWAFDINTFTPIGIVPLPNVSGTPRTMVRWGTNGLAFNTVAGFSSDSVSRIYLVQSPLVSTSGELPTSVQFADRFYAVQEGSGSIAINVTRAGDVSGTTRVDYATSDATAKERTDYTTASGTLIFAPGETSKTFSVLITDDAFLDPGETVNLTLSNVQGGAVVNAPATVALTIQDNDFSGTAPNPIDNSAFFVRQHYNDLLNRVADSDGLTFWINEIAICGNDPQCIAAKRVNVSAAFFLSVEFQQTGYLVYRLQKSSFGSLPRYKPFLRDTQAIGQGVVVNAPGWELLLESNKQSFLNEWVDRPAFHTLYDPLSNAGYVDALIANTGVAFTASERDALITGLDTSTETRSTVLRKVAENEAFTQKEFNPAFVLMQYFGYLRRNPDDVPDANLDGYNFWLGKLNEFNGDFVKAEMVKAFITSGEYRGRFGTP